MALSKATAETIRLRKLLQELGFVQNNSTIIYLDSQSAIALRENPKYHSRNKYVDIIYHFIKQKKFLHKKFSSNIFQPQIW